LHTTAAHTSALPLHDALPISTVTFSFVDPGCTTCTTTSSPIGINAQGLASTTFTYSFAGTFLVTASFSGDTSYTPSSKAIVQLVNSATATATATTVSASPNEIGRAPCSATTEGTAAAPPVIKTPNPPTVTFSFVDPGCATCTTTSSPIDINAQGLASTTFTYSFAGTFLVTASFSGDTSYTPSSKGIVQLVNSATATATATSVSASPN